MEERPVPRGRGAALAEALRRRQQQAEKPVGIEDEPPKEESPPKPRGRAALLKQLQEKRLQKVGEDVAQRSSAAPSAVTEVTKAMSEVSMSSIQSEPVNFKGSAGTTIPAFCNYIRLNMEKDKGVYEYEVKFEPPLDAKSLRYNLVNTVVATVGGGVRSYDGGNVLYLPTKLTNAVTDTVTSIPNQMDKVTVRLIYKRVSRLADSLHLYNVLFKRIMSALLYAQMGRNFFNPSHKFLIPQHKLEVLPGFAVAVDELDDGLLLCLDTQHRVIRTQNAYELLQEFRCANPHEFKENANKNIIGACIFTRYNNKTYIVDDIAWNMTPLDTFPTRDGTVVSFVNYYKQHYNITIQDVHQPLLINRKSVKESGSAEKVDRLVCLVPELSFLTGLTDVMRNDFKVMKDVAQYTRVTPNQRIQALRKYLQNVKESEKAQQILADWGLSFQSDSLSLPARQLEPETILFGGSASYRCNNAADWARAAGDNQLTGPVDMKRWILFYTKRDERNAKMFAEAMVRLSGVMGCQISPPRLVLVENDRTDAYMEICQKHITDQVQIVVFLCPTSRTDRYTVIKKICCTQLPVPSQVINSKTLSNPAKVRTIIQKIAMQMTCKLGGSLWTVRFPFKGWMICGTDVYHAVKQTSVCGFVCSLNESITRWFSVATFQEKEIGDYYRIAFRKCLEMYKLENNAFPEKIIMFRDGLSLGQLEQCKRYEIEQFNNVLKDLNLETTITFITVQKRINTRIFAQQGPDFVNPNPGTVVDHTVTRKNLCDFFLIPQSVRQGTVNPTHYIVLHNDCNLKPDQVQRLSYKLCHLYYNWTGTIRVPAPCMYAHKLASLVGQHIKKQPSAILNDKLFYL